LPTLAGASGGAEFQTAVLLRLLIAQKRNYAFHEPRFAEDKSSHLSGKVIIRTD
jgi:hypothetical protein